MQLYSSMQRFGLFFIHNVKAMRINPANVRLDEDVFAKTSSRHLQDVLQRCVQEVFKTDHQVKLFLLTRFQHVFEKYSQCF